MNKKYLNKAFVILMILVMIPVLLSGCTWGKEPQESSTASSEAPSVTDTAAPGTDLVEDTMISCVLYAFQKADITRTFLLDHNGTPLVMKNIPEALNRKLQNEFRSGQQVDVYYEKGIEETYPGAIYPVDVKLSEPAREEADIRFLQEAALLGWTTPVGLVNVQPFLLTNTENLRLSAVPSAVAFSGDGSSLDVCCILDKEGGEVTLPVVTYQLKKEMPHQEEEGPERVTNMLIREVTVDSGTTKQTYYLCASFERYAWRLITENYLFDSKEHTDEPDSGRPAFSLTELELSMLAVLQMGIGPDISAFREAYNRGEQQGVWEALRTADEHLSQMGKERVWIAGYDNYLREDTFNPAFPDMDKADGRQPPALTVRSNDQEAEAIRLTYSWISTESESYLALQVPEEQVGCIVTDPSEGNTCELSLRFENQPYQVRVRYWPEEIALKVAEHPDSVMNYLDDYTEVTVTDGMITVPADLPCRFEVYAKWVKGVCEYTFRTEASEKQH